MRAVNAQTLRHEGDSTHSWTLFHTSSTRSRTFVKSSLFAIAIPRRHSGAFYIARRPHGGPLQPHNRSDMKETSHLLATTHTSLITHTTECTYICRCRTTQHIPRQHHDGHLQPHRRSDIKASPHMTSQQHCRSDMEASPHQHRWTPPAPDKARPSCNDCERLRARPAARRLNTSFLPLQASTQSTPHTLQDDTTHSHTLHGDHHQQHRRSDIKQTCTQPRRIAAQTKKANPPKPN